jgi:hypothetical protein
MATPRRVTPFSKTKRRKLPRKFTIAHLTDSVTRIALLWDTGSTWRPPRPQACTATGGGARRRSCHRGTQDGVGVLQSQHCMSWRGNGSRWQTVRLMRQLKGEPPLFNLACQNRPLRPRRLHPLRRRLEFHLWYCIGAPPPPETSPLTS